MNTTATEPQTALIVQLQTVASHFRLGRESFALEHFYLLTERLQHLSQTWPPNTLEELNQILAPMLACQQRCDWFGLADYLEFELIALLEAQNT